jgi:hypothetical protein
VDPHRRRAEVRERQDMPCRNASCACAANATWNARPECDSRITNTHDLIQTPAIVAQTHRYRPRLPRPTDGFASPPPRPGSDPARPCGGRQTATRSPQPASPRAQRPGAASHTRRAVCRCLRDASRSTGSQPSMISTYGSIASRGRADRRSVVVGPRWPRPAATDSPTPAPGTQCCSPTSTPAAGARPGSAHRPRPAHAYMPSINSPGRPDSSHDRNLTRSSRPRRVRLR